MNIFVGNLSRDATEEDLRRAFAAYGQVDKVSVLKDKFTGEPRGFGSRRDGEQDRGAGSDRRPEPKRK